MNLNRVDAKGGIEEGLVGEPLIGGELLSNICKHESGPQEEQPELWPPEFM